MNLEVASTHKSAKTHTDTVFLPLETSTFDLLTPKINGVSGLVLDHFYVKSVSPI